MAHRPVLAALLAAGLAAVPAGWAAAAPPAAAPAAASAGTAASAASCPWVSSHASPTARADAVLAHLTLTQKIGLVHQYLGDMVGSYGAAGYVPGIPALCVPPLLLNDAGSGLGDAQTDVTAYPAGIAQAASWDPALAQQLGASLGGEAHAKGVDVLLAPDVNITRTPLGGRTSEQLGEDPYLSGQLAAAFIRGVQAQHVIATVKHFDANSQEVNRATINEDIDQRTLHEIYQRAFATAIQQGHAGAVMCAYNQVNGAYACQNPSLLSTDLRAQLHFSGFVMSDWGATHSTVPSARAGLDMEMDVGQAPDATEPYAGNNQAWEDYYGAPLQRAVQDGQVPVSVLNGMVRDILRSMFAVGVFNDPPPAEPAAYATPVDTPAAQHVALAAAEAGSVLLKDAGGVLPITGRGLRIAVIGADAGAGAETVAQAGGSVHVLQPDIVTPLQGITERATAAGDSVVYNDGASPQAAAAVAARADVAVVDVGYVESEGSDLANLDYTDGVCELTCLTQPSDADALISAVAAANKHTVVLLNTGGPALMPWLPSVAGVLEMWYPGEEDGAAAAALLFGDVNPSGKLPLTFPAALSQLPTRTAAQYPGVDGTMHYSEGLLVGYRWYDAKRLVPLFPFGYGLSYTTFSFSGLQLRSTADGFVASVTVRNTGRRTGTDVAQLYVGYPAGSGEPPRQLEGFRRVTVAPGRAVRISFDVPRRQLAVWTGGWRVLSGDYQVAVGDSSRHLPLQGSVAVG